VRKGHDSPVCSSQRGTVGRRGWLRESRWPPVAWQQRSTDPGRPSWMLCFAAMRNVHTMRPAQQKSFWPSPAHVDELVNRSLFAPWSPRGRWCASGIAAPGHGRPGRATRQKSAAEEVGRSCAAVGFERACDLHYITARSRCACGAGRFLLTSGTGRRRDRVASTTTPAPGW